jgi:hypothetical protein
LALADGEFLAVIAGDPEVSRNWEQTTQFDETPNDFEKTRSKIVYLLSRGSSNFLDMVLEAHLACTASHKLDHTGLDVAAIGKPTRNL